jgi:uncharacterized membrane protein
MFRPVAVATISHQHNFGSGIAIAPSDSIDAVRRAEELIRGVHMQHTQTRGEGLAKGLGWFSIGLGLAEMASPQSVAQLVGIEDGARTRAMIRGYGARELANGVAILSQPDARWLWARVAGDVVDLSSLAAALQRDNADGRKVALGLASVAGVMVADIVAARRLGSHAERSLGPEKRKDNTLRVSKTFTINRSREEVYGFWRQLDNLPRFMSHLESVELLGNQRSRWVARGPGGFKVIWEAETIEDAPNRSISWRSLPGSQIDNRGTVRFDRAPGNRGTELRVLLEYAPPGGRAANLLVRMIGQSPDQLIQEDLRRLKQLLETGEIANSSGSSRIMQPAQPTGYGEPRMAGGRR